MDNKAIILLGGPAKGTRFRPLSLHKPKPIFPIGGVPLIYHTIESLSKVPNMKEIILLGCFTDLNEIEKFIYMCEEKFKINIKYLKENEIMGSAGGIFKYKKDILLGKVDNFFVINGDVLGDMPFKEMLKFHDNFCNQEQYIIMGKYNDPSQSFNYGCISYDEKTKEILHFVEKPLEFSSNVISCGAYLFTSTIFDHLQSALTNSLKTGNELINTRNDSQNFNNHTLDMNESNASSETGDNISCIKTPSHFTYKSVKLSFELDIFPELAGKSGHLFGYILPQNTPWMQIKSSSSAIYADQMILNLYTKNHSELLAINSKSTCTVIGNVFIHPTASVHNTSVLGPDVSICAGAIIGPGARISHSIICDNVHIQDHAFVTCSIIGWNSIVGRWTRIEGTDCRDDISIHSLFSPQGKLNPSVTIIANDVDVHSELVVFNAIVLPNKELKECTQNQIVL